jgi:hypothetical protein
MSFGRKAPFALNSVPEPDATSKTNSIAEELPPVPKSRLLKLALNTPIDSDTAVTGDPIQAHVTKSVKGKDGHVVIPAGAVAHGRILRLVHYAYPFDGLELILKFDALEVGGDVVKIRLSPPETPATESVVEYSRAFGKQNTLVVVQHDKTHSTIEQEDRKNGTGTFEFNHTSHIHLPPGHVLDWTVN